MDIGPPELLIVAVILLVLFGGSKIPQLARNLGKAKSELEAGMREGREGTSDAATATASTPPPASVTPPTSPAALIVDTTAVDESQPTPPAAS